MTIRLVRVVPAGEENPLDASFHPGRELPRSDVTQSRLRSLSQGNVVSTRGSILG